MGWRGFQKAPLKFQLSDSLPYKFIREFEAPCLVSYVADGSVGGSVRLFLKNEAYRFFRSSIESVDFSNRKRLIKTRRNPKGDEITPEAIKLWADFGASVGFGFVFSYFIFPDITRDLPNKKNMVSPFSKIQEYLGL